MQPNPSCALCGWLNHLQIHREPSSQGMQLSSALLLGFLYHRGCWLWQLGIDGSIGKIISQGYSQLKGMGAGDKYSSLPPSRCFWGWLSGSLGVSMLHPQQQARWYPTAGSSFPLFCFLHILIALPRVTSQVSLPVSKPHLRLCFGGTQDPPRKIIDSGGGGRAGDLHSDLGHHFSDAGR